MSSTSPSASFRDPSSNGSRDVAGKFRLFRIGAESNGRKLKDANEIIGQLKEEINCSRDSEKNLRNQLSSAQDRLITLQQTFKESITVLERQRKTERISERIGQRVEEIAEAIKQAREKSQTILQHVSKESDLMREITELRSVLAKKNREYDLMKMEIQTLITQKKKLEIDNEQKLSNLQKEFDELKRRETDKEVNYNETLLYYQQQLNENEQKLTLYEKERKKFLGDFEILKASKPESHKFARADSTVLITGTERFPESSDFKCDKTKADESLERVFQCSPSNKKPKLLSFRRKPGENFSQTSKKQKPQLDFLTTTQHSSQTAQTATKRRLFSTNSNHYTDNQFNE